MRIALAQINPTVGDIAGNGRLIERFTQQAREQGAQLVVFPELAVSGYPPRDLLYQEGFLEAAADEAKRIGETCSSGLTLVFGVPLSLREAPASSSSASHQREGIANCLLAYRDGKLLDYYDKRLLPTYDVFDEDRYFIAGRRAVVIGVPSATGVNVKVGLSICEDLWKGEDAGFAQRYFNEPDPVPELVALGARLIVNPSASPFVLGKGRKHRDILRKHATKHHVYVAAVNQVGGNDELVFDGHAAVFDPGGELLVAGKGFEEQLVIADVPCEPGEVSEASQVSPASAQPRAIAFPENEPQPSGSGPPARLRSGFVSDPIIDSPDAELLFKAIVLGVRDYLRKTGFKSALLGLSGGIDSAVTAVIAAAALGSANVLGVSLPSGYSSEGSKADAIELVRRLGMPLRTIPIEPSFQTMLKTLAPCFAGRSADVTEENLQSRIRGTILMALSNKLGHIVLTTGNKSELAVGYCTLYGDMNGGLAVLSDVTKEWVYTLARWMNEHPGKLGIAGLTTPPIPQASITKPPSAELRPNQTDQDLLPPYPVLDEIIHRYVERRESPARIVKETGFDEAVVSRCVRLIDLSEYKRRQAAIGLKVTSVAFGSGRRMPVAQGWRPTKEPRA